MKRFLFPLLLGMLCAAPLARGQNPAGVAAAVARQEAEENQKRMQGELADLRESRAVQDKWLNDRLLALNQEVSRLREELGKPHPVYATAEDFKVLKQAIQEVDRKRAQDAERFEAQLKETLNKLLAVASRPAPTPPPQPRKEETVVEPPPQNETGFNYKIKAHDSLEKIAKAYQAKGVKVTADQIAKKNPKIDRHNLVIGKSFGFHRRQVR